MVDGFELFLLGVEMGIFFELNRLGIFEILRFLEGFFSLFGLRVLVF